MPGIQRRIQIGHGHRHHGHQVLEMRPLLYLDGFHVKLVFDMTMIFFDRPPMAIAPEGMSHHGSGIGQRGVDEKVTLPSILIHQYHEPERSVHDLVSMGRMGKAHRDGTPAIGLGDHPGLFDDPGCAGFSQFYAVRKGSDRPPVPGIHQVPRSLQPDDAGPAGFQPRMNQAAPVTTPVDHPGDPVRDMGCDLIDRL